MRRFTELLVVAAAAVFVLPAPASNIFGKKAAVNPEQRVQELIMTAQTAADANMRCDAVEELREFSTINFPQIVPVLVDVLRQDKSINVRVEAARSLGRLRPLTKMAGDALAEAAQKDSAFRVRWQARTSLTYFSVANINPHNHTPAEADPKAKITFKEGGYSSGGQVLVPGPNSPVIVPGGSVPPGGYSQPLPKGPDQVPVFVAPKPAPPAPQPPMIITPNPAPPVVGTPTAEPPLATPAPIPDPAPPQLAPIPEPLPPAQPPLPTPSAPPAAPPGNLIPGAPTTGEPPASVPVPPPAG